MSEERTYKGYDWLEEQSNGCLTHLVLRAGQGIAGLAGIYLEKSYFPENSFTLPTAFIYALTLFVILEIENLIRIDAQESHDLFDEPGQVESAE